MGRKVIDTAHSPFLAYDLEGPVQAEMSYLPISYDKISGQGCYVMRMAPGAVTRPHDHPGFEEFLVLEGELIDDDGARFKAGNFVSFTPGTRHHSWTETGCVLAVFEWRRWHGGD
jgi:anti-sigma factor ChrR (cupin superfamily)